MRIRSTWPIPAVDSTKRMDVFDVAPAWVRRFFCAEVLLSICRMFWVSSQLTAACAGTTSPKGGGEQADGNLLTIPLCNHSSECTFASPSSRLHSTLLQSSHPEFQPRRGIRATS